ncbi:DUF2238 domain-containing protein [Acinetobacter puyangensis]|uniref:DUF2238 domain-containing protein n=1 Tax=Acinetobacter puyangensis TaxID=1096779 RepID=UPI003A4E4CF3
MNKIKWACIITLLGMIAIASIKPLEMQSYLLHQVGTVLMLIALLYANHKITLSNLSFVLYFGFLAVHIVAAHYLYSYVPYNNWIQSLFHFDLNAFFGWQRNMFDRFVHFAYGFLLYPFFYQIFQHWLNPLKQSYKIALICIMWVMASSMFYELIEWWIAIGLSPEEAENYNGQQGDIWDAHQDMFLALLGSLIAWIAFPQKGSSK